nr:hypothetical protein CFP56_46320 [Quercus suber]
MISTVDRRRRNPRHGLCHRKGRPIQTHKDTVTHFQFQLNLSSNWTWSKGGYFQSLKSYSSSYSGTLSLSQQVERGFPQKNHGWDS